MLNQILLTFSQTQCTPSLADIVHCFSTEARIMVTYELILEGFLKLFLKLWFQLLFLKKKQQNKPNTILLKYYIQYYKVTDSRHIFVCVIGVCFW